jgi:predicted RNase H-like nuclease (RuvC/YqgF family)
MMRGVYRTVYRPILNTFAPKLSRQFEYLLEDLSETEESFARKIDDAYESLRQTSDLIKRLEDELDQKIQGVERLRREYEQYSELAQVEKGKAQALIKEIDSSLNRNKTREHLVAFGISLLAGLVIFVIGVVVGPSLRGWLGIGA